jgi:hypothetical protein
MFLVWQFFVKNLLSVVLVLFPDIFVNFCSFIIIIIIIIIVVVVVVIIIVIIIIIILYLVRYSLIIFRPLCKIGLKMN